MDQVRIIDASIAIKWFVVEPGRDRALQILKDVLDDPTQFAVPELFYFEINHIFHRLILEPNPDQIDLLYHVVKLPLMRFVMDKELCEQTGVFQGLGLSGYDAAYIALAKILNGFWLTFDQKAHQQIKHLNLSKLLQ
jgi:predicted nucleic acid-binding protein